MGGVRKNRKPTKVERMIARSIHRWIHKVDKVAMPAWQVSDRTVLIGHFRGRMYVRGGFGFAAVGTIGRVWDHVFQHLSHGEWLFYLVIEKMDRETGELVRIASFKTVYPDMIVDDVARVIGRIRNRKAKVELKRL